MDGVARLNYMSHSGEDGQLDHLRPAEGAETTCTWLGGAFHCAGCGLRQPFGCLRLLVEKRWEEGEGFVASAESGRSLIQEKQS
jgi:hypothetical protein